MATIAFPSSRPATAGPRPLRWTCAEFHRFGDMGVFEGRRAMLIDGVILEEGPMNPPHAITLELVEGRSEPPSGPGGGSAVSPRWSSAKTSTRSLTSR